jgi:hypothetical protein
MDAIHEEAEASMSAAILEYKAKEDIPAVRIQIHTVTFILYILIQLVTIFLDLSFHLLNSGSSVMLATTPHQMHITPLCHASLDRHTRLLGFNPSPGKRIEWHKPVRWMLP